MEFSCFPCEEINLSNLITNVKVIDSNNSLVEKCLIGKLLG